MSFYREQRYLHILLLYMWCCGKVNLCCATLAHVNLSAWMSALCSNDWYIYVCGTPGSDPMWQKIMSLTNPEQKSGCLIVQHTCIKCDTVWYIRLLTILLTYKSVSYIAICKQQRTLWKHMSKTMSSKPWLSPADTVNSSNLACYCYTVELLSLLTLKIIPKVRRAAEKDPDRNYLPPTRML